ncbi:LlaJI family restriction endonuclease [Dubosiella newyorkensis]|uniref:LlaJI family restriction endonuclease n=1 Tax=Dubosiella newyorkensis TaxID=1862672 RepID=UPI0023F0CCB9|nr:LlaJI family restriction endonuclease [Dubosiella newyorkensis]
MTEQVKMKKKVELIQVPSSNNFMGLKIEENRVKVFLPSVFRIEENWKRDVILFLKSLAIAKKQEEKMNAGNRENKDIWPIESYLWIIRDYIENGYFYIHEKTYKQSNTGKIDWKRTLKNVPLYSGDNIIYDKLVTTKTTPTNDIIAQTFKWCLKVSQERIGWLFNYNFQEEIYRKFSITEMIKAVRDNLNSTFDDQKNSNLCTYGVNNYYYAYETMIDNLFGGIQDQKKIYNPNGYWTLINHQRTKASDLRPDTILIKDKKTYILDAKMYKFGYTHSVKDLPETQSIQKQITYGDYIHHNLKDKHVRNSFILPYNKELEVFKKDNNLIRYLNDNLVYIGFADVDWRSDLNMEDYDNIFSYCIDFNYLLRNYRAPDHKMINSLCDSIEHRILEMRKIK